MGEDARLWIGSPGFEDQPPCGKNTYAPEGEATADIVRLFAEDHEAWQESFFNAWEKMQQNGYQQLELTAAPDNGHLLSQTEWYTGSEDNGSDNGFDMPSSWWDMPSSWELASSWETAARSDGSSGEERFEMPSSWDMPSSWEPETRSDGSSGEESFFDDISFM